MKIRVKHIHNKQAIQVKTNRNYWSNTKVFFQNVSRFNYWNDKLNGMRMVIPSEEQYHGSRGDY